MTIPDDTLLEMSEAASVRRRLLVLLGAGASYDCVHTDETRVEPGLCPPLVKDLFAPRPRFDEILKKYPRARSQADHIRSLVKEGVPLEKVLREMSENRSLSLRRCAWEVPLYLQEVLGEVSEGYILGGSTRFETMFGTIVRSAFRDVMILTVNYDLMVERAITGMIGHGFTDLERYFWNWDDQQHWFLIKLHGSVNWGSRLTPNLRAKNWPDIIPSLTELKRDGPIRVLNGYRDNHRNWEGDFHYPALALPVLDKTEFVCPEKQLTVASEMAPSADHLLVVGFSGLDTHVLDKFIQPLTSVVALRVVCGSDQAGRETLSRIVKVNSRLDLPSAVYGGRFRDFVGLGDLNSFLGVERLRS